MHKTSTLASTRQFLLTPDTGPGRTQTLLTAFAYLPPGGRTRSIEQLEVEGEIKQQLYAISKSTGENPNQREYAGGDQSLYLTPGQIEVLRQRIVECPFWNPLMADVIAETYRWLGLSGIAAEE